MNVPFDGLEAVGSHNHARLERPQLARSAGSGDADGSVRVIRRPCGWFRPAPALPSWVAAPQFQAAETACGDG
jgi:hypothetical protein